MGRVVAVFLAGFLAVLAILAPGSAIAQTFCTTNFGTCPMAGGMAGGPCFCATPTGPIQGIVQIAGGGMASRFPQFCCTPAGRIGPFQNNSIGPGQVCQAPSAAGMLFGQACY